MQNVLTIILGENSRFERAYFILKSNEGACSGKNDDINNSVGAYDMVAEAERIVALANGEAELASSSGKKVKKNKRSRRFLSGFLTGLGVCATILIATELARILFT